MKKSALIQRLRRGSLVALSVTTLAAAGCGGGGGGDSTASSAANTSIPTSSAVPGSTPTMTTPAMPAPGSRSANSAPIISGAPAKTIAAGQTYSAAPAAQDADGDALAFSIENKPSWAQFSTATGQLTGTPAAKDVGTYSNVVITVSDGVASSALPKFAITVAAVGAPGVQAPTLQWEAPTETIEDAPIASLAGYRIYYGGSAEVLNNSIVVPSAATLTYVVDSLTPGTYYFAVRAVDSDGIESTLSNVTKIVIS